MANRYSIAALKKMAVAGTIRPKFKCMKKPLGSSPGFVLLASYTLVSVRKDAAGMGIVTLKKLLGNVNAQSVPLSEFKRCFTHEGKAFRKDVPPAAPEPTAFIVTVDTDDDDDAEKYVIFDKKEAIAFALRAMRDNDDVDGVSVTVHEVKGKQSIASGKHVGTVEKETAYRFKNADGTFFVEKV